MPHACGRGCLVPSHETNRPNSGPNRQNHVSRPVFVDNFPFFALSGISRSLCAVSLAAFPCSSTPYSPEPHSLLSLSHSLFVVCVCAVPLPTPAADDECAVSGWHQPREHRARHVGECDERDPPQLPGQEAWGGPGRCGQQVRNGEVILRYEFSSRNSPQLFSSPSHEGAECICTHGWALGQDHMGAQVREENPSLARGT